MFSYISCVNEKWLLQQIPPKKICIWKREEFSETHFDELQMPVLIIQQNVTPVGLFEQFFDDDVIAFIFTQIETRKNMNSKLMLPKYFYLSQCCFLLDIIHCLEESVTGKPQQTSTMLLCIAIVLKRYCSYVILLTI